MLNHFIKIELTAFILIVNIPFVLFGIKQISQEFALKSAIAILVLAVCVHWLNIPIFTNDKLLISIFGGIFLGAGIGVTIISPHNELIRDTLVHALNRGVTVYKTETGYISNGNTAEESKAIFCVVTRLEVTSLLMEIE